MNYVVITVHNLKTQHTSKNVQFRLKLIQKLVIALQKIYRDSVLYKESMYHQKLKTQHPDVYSAVINKRIDLDTAYKWSSEDVNTNRKFSYKLDQLLDQMTIIA